jgi:hypothetical protein
MPLSNKRDEYKLVGAHFSPQVYQYITLYSLAKRTNKTGIVRKLIQDWMARQRLENSETKLVSEIINRAKQDWEVYQKLYPERTLSQYKEKLRSDLQIKRVNETYIKRIIAAI